MFEIIIMFLFIEKINKIIKKKERKKKKKQQQQWNKIKYFLNKKKNIIYV